MTILVFVSSMSKKISSDTRSQQSFRYTDMRRSFILYTIISLILAIKWVQCNSSSRFNVASNGDQRAETCDINRCHLPDCFCGGNIVPGNLSRDQLPQFVLLTFDDAVNGLNKKLFEELFQNRTNPNGCPIKATFFVSHEWTDYSQVQNLYAGGHEIATHTVTHSHGTKFSEERWANELIGMAEMLVRYAGVQPYDVKGMRAPFLAVGGDKMFTTLNRYGLYYDSSMTVSRPSWPYTLDYKMPHSCAIHPCPEKSHPKMWEVPMSVIKDVRGGTCSMADGCFYDEDTTSIQKIFTQNFLDTYTGSKAPFPLFFHAAWFFNRPHRKEAFINFINSILRLSDVYFVTNQELIKWVRFPVPIQSLAASKHFRCDLASNQRPGRCMKQSTNVCQLSHKGDTRHFSTCQRSCPKRYPWVDNLNGV